MRVPDAGGKWVHGPPLTCQLSSHAAQDILDKTGATIIAYRIPEVL
jgi:hypothetical protein